MQNHIELLLLQQYPRELTVVIEISVFVHVIWLQQATCEHWALQSKA